MARTREGRSLYQCFHAKVFGDGIFCEKGYNLMGLKTVNIERLKRGESLIMSICKKCPDYDEMGPPIEKEERGWGIRCQIM